MKKIGIIVEYNPLHNGHLHHFNEVKKRARPDIIIACMSGNVTMRGDLSVIDKFGKTELALKMGIDLIIELPLVLACNSADLFAYYSVLMLNNAQVDEIWIGCETANIPFEDYKNALESQIFTNLLREQLALGLSYKMAVNCVFEKLGLAILNSNATLALAYYLAISKINSKIKLYTIPRIENDYLDKTLPVGNIASATSIRNNFSLHSQYVPSYVETYFNKHPLINEEAVFPFLKYKILSSTCSDSFLIDEGITQLMKRNIGCSSYFEFYSALTNKRYTTSKIKRICIYLLFQITKQEIERIRLSTPNFIRVLGYTNVGKQYLNVLKKETKIYTNIKEGLNPILDIEIKVTKILDFIYQNALLKKEQSAPIFIDYEKSTSN